MFRITAFKYAESTIPESMVFAGGHPRYRRKIAFLFFLVETKHRKVLIDTGAESVRGFDLTRQIAPADALRAYGLAPEEITDIIITHAHHDHIGCVADFPHAIVYIQRDEAVLGARYLEGRRIKTFFASATVAGILKVFRIGGHSVGSCIVIAPYKNKKFLFVGDECYDIECLKDRRPTGASCDLKKSDRFVCTYSSQEYTPLIFHDPNLVPDTKRFRVLFSASEI